MKIGKISALKPEFTKETFDLAYSLERYQLVNALVGVATSLAERLDPGGRDEEHFFRAVVITRQGLDATMGAPDVYPLLFGGYFDQPEN